MNAERHLPVRSTMVSVLTLRGAGAATQTLVARRTGAYLDGEHSAFRWVSLEEAAALLPFGSQRELLAHVRREFVEREPSPFLRLALD